MSLRIASALDLSEERPAESGHGKLDEGRNSCKATALAPPSRREGSTMPNNKSKRPGYLDDRLRRFTEMFIVSNSFFHNGTPCHIWQARIQNNGYGMYWWSGRLGLAHRFAYERATGSLPEGKVLDHLCRRPACVNPLHLEAVTQQVNARRGLAGQRLRDMTHCWAGHPFDDINTYIDPRGHRTCKKCHNARNLAYRNRRRLNLISDLAASP